MKDYLNKFYTEEWLFALVSLGFTFGWSVSGFPPSIILACSCWAVTIAVLLHYFWVWSRKANLHRWITVGAIICFSFIILLFSWKPVKERYIAEHLPPPPTPAEALIMNTLTNKPTISLGVVWNARITNIEEVDSLKLKLQELSPGNNDVYLHSFSDIQMCFLISGKELMSDIKIELLAPWIDGAILTNGSRSWTNIEGNRVTFGYTSGLTQSPDLTGDDGWTDWGVFGVTPSEHMPFDTGYILVYETKGLQNPGSYIPLPGLRLSPNYTNPVMVTQWTIESRNTDAEKFNVTYHFD